MSNFTKFIAISAKEIEQEIQATVSEKVSGKSKVAAEQTLFFESVLGGKNIRGALVKLGYTIAGGSESKTILRIAAAFEILHTSFLIHDDIIDKSLKRRGKPTMHKVLGGGHYGRSQAMCLGDYGFFLATKMITESTFSSESKTQALSYFYEMAMDTIIGEMYDIKYALLEKEKKEEDVLTIHKFKTAHYTIVGPLVVGALLAKADKKTLDALQAFGEHIGMAFQIQDDILGIFGDDKIIGKSTLSDIEENKNTLLIAHALANATPAQKKILRELYGKGKITRDQQNKIKKVLEETQSLEYSRMKVREYTDKGRKVIDSITKDGEIRQLLNELVDLIIQRVA